MFLFRTCFSTHCVSARGCRRNAVLKNFAPYFRVPLLQEMWCRAITPNEAAYRECRYTFQQANLAKCLPHPSTKLDFRLDERMNDADTTISFPLVEVCVFGRGCFVDMFFLLHPLRWKWALCWVYMERLWHGSLSLVPKVPLLWLNTSLVVTFMNAEQQSSLSCCNWSWLELIKISAFPGCGCGMGRY